jgi:hypothetical protein
LDKGLGYRHVRFSVSGTDYISYLL